MDTCHASLTPLFHNNRAWAAGMRAADPDFFTRLVDQQNPRWLWIGCSDSRVPANQIIGLDPGEVFVHRNVANLVQPGDLNCMSMLQFAVEVLRVEHVIVCGHYDCGGVRAALEDSAHGLVDYWIWSIREMRTRHAAGLAGLAGRQLRDTLCELNIIEQVERLAKTKILREAWERDWPVQVHGLVYRLADGLIQDLGVSLDCSGSQIERVRAAEQACLVRGRAQGE
ncbi:MAG: carbonic anhydrase [Candidatus Delongbacteria bacterium]